MKELKCEKCEKTFKRYFGLQKHMLTHNENRTRSYICEICDSAHFDLSTLERHFKTHFYIETYECDICEKKFTDASHLKKHFFEVHEKLNDKKIECEFCHKKYLPRHLRVGLFTTSPNW